MMAYICEFRGSDAKLFCRGVEGYIHGMAWQEGSRFETKLVYHVFMQYA